MRGEPSIARHRQLSEPVRQARCVLHIAHGLALAHFLSFLPARMKAQRSLRHQYDNRRTQLEMPHFRTLHQLERRLAILVIPLAYRPPARLGDQAVPPVRPQRACRLEWAEYTQMDAECKDRRQIFSSFSGRCCFGAAKGRGMPQKVAESCGLLKVFRRGAEPSGPGKTLPWQLHLLCGMVFCSKI